MTKINDNFVLSYRQELQEALCRYTTDTLTYIYTVRGFCEGISTWKDAREKDLSKLEEIKDRAKKVDLSFSHVTQSKSKKKGLWEYVKNTVTSEYDDSRRAELQRELAAVLEVILKGLKKLAHFLGAVEKLAVTSLHVFMEENQVLHLPKGISLEHVQVVINAARLICPLLLKFKRDASDFFLPKLQNVEVLSYELDEYTETTRMICEDLEKRSYIFFHLPMTKKHLADLGGNLSEDDKQRIVCQINQHYVFKSFMEDVQSLQGCLEEVISKQIIKIEAFKMDVLAEIKKVLSSVKAIRKGIDVIVDAGSAFKLLNRPGRVVVEEGTAVSNVSRVAIKGPLALSKTARVGFIGLNVLFLGMDVFFICKDGYSLSKGSETVVSQFIRARAALWSSEMDSWKKIHDSLCKGQKTSEKHRAVLDKTFYPEKAINRKEKRESSICGNTHSVHIHFI
uniref:Uncharacterized protein n=1 Tax=Sparus aurata TaxID=8175 RepID=A0A671Z0R6_SPAAU